MSDSMKDKIRKLLILANDKGATEGEKDSALAMAQNLMMKYNIQIDISQEEIKIMAGEIYGKEYKRRWHKLIASAVAHMYVCRIVNYEEGFKYVGRPESIEACQMTLDYIVDQIEELWKLHKKKLKSQGGSIDDDNYRRSFKWGAASRVWGRVEEMRSDMTKNDEKAQAATGCTALVVVNTIKKQEEEISAFMDATMNLRKGRGMTPPKGGGHGAGRAAGDQVKITKDIAETRKQIEGRK